MVEGDPTNRLVPGSRRGTSRRSERREDDARWQPMWLRRTSRVVQLGYKEPVKEAMRVPRPELADLDFEIPF
jgi:hypothetical protein